MRNVQECGMVARTIALRQRPWRYYSTPPMSHNETDAARTMSCIGGGLLTTHVIRHAGRRAREKSRGGDDDGPSVVLGEKPDVARRRLGASLHICLGTCMLALLTTMLRLTSVATIALYGIAWHQRVLRTKSTDTADVLAKTSARPGNDNHSFSSSPSTAYIHERFEAKPARVFQQGGSKSCSVRAAAVSAPSDRVPDCASSPLSSLSMRPRIPIPVLT